MRQIDYWIISPFPFCAVLKAKASLLLGTEKCTREKLLREKDERETKREKFKVRAQ